MSKKESRKQRKLRKAKERRQVEQAIKDIQFYSRFVPTVHLDTPEKVAAFFEDDNNW